MQAQSQIAPFIDLAQTSWTVNENEKCKQIVQSAGATLVGYPPGAARPADFTSMLGTYYSSWILLCLRLT